MNTKFIKHYDSPHQFEPLIPGDFVMGPLFEKASDLQKECLKLSAFTPVAKKELSKLLRKMNSYYTNLIEGEHTRPSDIDKALSKNYSTNLDMARKQRLAVSHIETEEKFELIINKIILENKNPVLWLYSKEALKEIHSDLFKHQINADLKLIDGSLLTPGEFRTCFVAVGRHEAPTPESLNAFLDYWSSRYAGIRRGEYSIIAAMAAHHRLAWIHPFADGNGRVTRLQTHLLMHAFGLTSGIWSPLRGFARTESKYKSLLQAADEHRKGDLDGRGNLTQSGLINWINYVLDICIDQAQFMAQQLDIKGIFDRISAAMMFEELTIKNGIRKESITPLKFLFSTQIEMSRAEFKNMSGLGDRIATENLSALIRKGYVVSDTPYGKVRFGIPQQALRFYFPSLWTEAEIDESTFCLNEKLVTPQTNYER